MKNIHLVGLGIKSIAHLTSETIASIAKADIVLYLANEPIIKEWIVQNSKISVSLDLAYSSDFKRVEAYKKVVDEVIFYLKSNDNLCVALYGHPLICSSLGIMLSEISIDDHNVNVEVYPAVSAEDCIFADLKIDPLSHGCYSAEATDFLLYNSHIDTSSHVLIWQVGMVGCMGLPNNGSFNIKAQNLLKEKLQGLYCDDFEVILYEASMYPGLPAKIINLKLNYLFSHKITAVSTLYIPPFTQKKIDKGVAKYIGLN